MNNIFELLQEIFFMKEPKGEQIGLSNLKKASINTIKNVKITPKSIQPKELKISELMRKSRA